MKKLILCIVFVLSMFSFNNFAEAHSNNLNKSDIHALVIDNVLTVKFKVELNAKTVHAKNFIVSDSKGKKVNSLKISLSDNKKEVTISNFKSNSKGNYFNLTISKNLESAKGDNFKNDLKLKFTTEKGDIDVSNVTSAFNAYVTDLENQLQQKNNTIAALQERIRQLEQQTSTTPSTPSSSALSKTIDDVTIQIDKVLQDSDSLKIYITYINNSDEEAMTGDSLSKIVANGKQFSYNDDFNFVRWYNKDVPHAADYIEDGVTERSVIFFPTTSATKINIVLNANFEQYRFNDVIIQK
ncbi:hypothetical protein [Solibacillus sp. CAU 1738]|uniref:hypothetical protein n=1 Tax=Solibacillus sp. CAU 1738 TaxID=3140363 RepID=UPI003261AA37